MKIYPYTLFIMKRMNIMTIAMETYNLLYVSPKFIGNLKENWLMLLYRLLCHKGNISNGLKGLALII